MNRGDAKTLTLNIFINNEPITSDYADEIEVTFNKECGSFCVQKTLSNGDITWNEAVSKYQMFLSQEDTFKLKTGVNTVQLRLLKGDVVISSIINSFTIGGVNSKEVLE